MTSVGGFASSLVYSFVFGYLFFVGPYSELKTAQTFAKMGRSKETIATKWLMDAHHKHAKTINFKTHFFCLKRICLVSKSCRGCYKRNCIEPG